MSQDPSGDSVTYYTARKTRAGQWSSSFPMRNQRLVEADSLAQGHTARQWQRQDLNPGPVTPERFPPCVAAAPLEERRLPLPFNHVEDEFALAQTALRLDLQASCKSVAIF